MEDDAGRDARAAVSDELSVRQLRQRCVPRRVQRAGDPARDAVDRIRLTTPADREPRVDDDELVEVGGQRFAPDRVPAALASARRSPVRSPPRRCGAGRATRRGRSRRSRRARNAGGATRAARRRRESRRRPRTRRPRSHTSTPLPRTARLDGSGWRPPDPAGADRSRSTSMNAAPGMWDSR